MNLTWLLRMARWVRHPPSQRRMIIGAVAIAAALAIAGLGALGWWPDWARIDAGRGHRFRP